MSDFIPNGTYKSGQYADKLLPQALAISTAVVNGNHLTLTTIMNGTNVINRGNYQIAGNSLNLAGENYSFTSGADGFFLDGVWFAKSAETKTGWY